LALDLDFAPSAVEFVDEFGKDGECLEEDEEDTD
jgi:hypothetical protein